MNNSIARLLKPIIDKFNNLRLILFIVVIIGGLIFCILTLNNILQKPPAVDTETSIANNRIDQTTINSLNRLKTSSDNIEIQALPTSRINPFSE